MNFSETLQNHCFFGMYQFENLEFICWKKSRTFNLKAEKQNFMASPLLFWWSKHFHFICSIYLRMLILRHCAKWKSKESQIERETTNQISFCKSWTFLSNSNNWNENASTTKMKTILAMVVSVFFVIWNNWFHF